MSEHGGVWLVTGAMAAGKSTVAQLLAARFERGVHVHGAAFARWAVTGWEQPAAGELTARARELLELRYRLSAAAADSYAEAGFTVVAQDNIFGTDVTGWLDRVRTRPRHLVVLRPSPQALAYRETARRQSTGKVAYRAGRPSIADLDALVATIPARGLWLDTTVLTAQQTVGLIWLRRAEACLDDPAAPPPTTAQRPPTVVAP